jgi:hypothetical protein
MERGQIIIETFENAFEAEVAKGYLETAGIAATIDKDDVGSMIPSLQLSAGVRLIVPEKQAERAKEILQARRRSPVDPRGTQ